MNKRSYQIIDGSVVVVLFLGHLDEGSAFDVVHRRAGPVSNPDLSGIPCRPVRLSSEFHWPLQKQKYLNVIYSGGSMVGWSMAFGF